MSRVSDRAAMVTIAIKQMIATTPQKQLRQAIEDYLRDEFADIARQLAADLPSNGEMPC